MSLFWGRTLADYSRTPALLWLESEGFDFLFWLSMTEYVGQQHSLQQIINPDPGLNHRNGEPITAIHPRIPLRDVPPRFRGSPEAKLQQIKTAI